MKANSEHEQKGAKDAEGHNIGGEFKAKATTITKEQANQIKHGMDSMLRAAKAKADVKNACYRGSDGIEWVDFLWGDIGAGAPHFKGGKGVAKVIAKRDFEKAKNPSDPSGARTLMRIPAVIVLGKVTHLLRKAPEPGKPEAERIQIDHTIEGETYQVFLVRDKGQKNHWMLSGFEQPHLRRQISAPGGTGEVYDSRGPTPTGPTLSRSDGGAGASKG